MKSKPKAILKYGLIFIVTGILFWILLKDIPYAEFQKALEDFDYRWIGLSMFLTIFGHLLRAWRWSLLINSAGHNIRLSTSFFAVMIGYFINSFVPRLGEFSRCGVAFRSDKIPIPYALGTVVTERIIDLLMLLALTAVTFSLQFNLLRAYLVSAQDQASQFITNYGLLLFFIGCLGIGTLFILFYMGRQKPNSIYSKLLALVREGLSGVLSLRKVTNQSGFWLATLGIWAFYFFMMYVITFGSDITENIGVLAGLSILVMGSFGMASPTPNGLVTFHAFVAGVLVLYGIPRQEGIIFATILHTSQLITVLIIGSISLILVNVRQKKTNIEAQQT